MLVYLRYSYLRSVAMEGASPPSLLAAMLFTVPGLIAGNHSTASRRVCADLPPKHIGYQ